MKTTDQHFADWESDAFGYGYGTGEEHLLPLMKEFYRALRSASPYNHEKLEKQFTAPVAWLMINILCQNNHIEYGSSPRHGWLTPSGERMADYLATRTVDKLGELCGLTMHDDNYIHCLRDHCNCDGDVKCENPFWKD